MRTGWPATVPHDDTKTVVIAILLDEDDWIMVREMERVSDIVRTSIHRIQHVDEMQDCCMVGTMFLE